MNLARYSKEYIDGIESFLDFAYSYGDPHGEKIQCPCAKCCNILWNRRNVVYDHLICHGFIKGYTRWINHGEWDIKLNVDDDMDYSCDDINGLLNINLEMLHWLEEFMMVQIKMPRYSVAYLKRQTKNYILVI